MPPKTDDDTKPETSPPPAAPKAGDEVLFWPERKPFIQAAFKAQLMAVEGSKAQLLVSNHQTGRTFNVDACEYSAEPAPGCWGLPKPAIDAT